MERQTTHIESLARYIRYLILTSSYRAQSGHPTSSLSAVELMTSLLFGGTFRYNPDNPGYAGNDRLIFSKGHATPLYYALWIAAGRVSEEEMMTYRTFGSRLEGHPTAAFPYVDAATGSLGQGLSAGVGMALGAARLDRVPARTFVLLGDSEMTEGSQWESMQFAAHYELDNLVGILDVNRLGQRGETMYGWDMDAWHRRIAAFGWETIGVDGHEIGAVLDALAKAVAIKGRPVMIVARTVKGKGVADLENRNGFHGKPPTEEQFQKALTELGDVDKQIRGSLSAPPQVEPVSEPAEKVAPPEYEPGASVATRKAYGAALTRLKPSLPRIVALDGEVSNSTHADIFAGRYPEHFFEMFVAEQNMVGVAVGVSRLGKKPFVSTFAAFLTRAFDQIRMAPHSDADIAFVGSHAGVSIGKDGPSQMGLEDLAMFRTIPGSIVLYPCDAVSTERLVEEAARFRGISYIRTTRPATPVIYDNDERFPVGGSKVLRRSDEDTMTIVSAGYTLHESLKAADELADKGLGVRVIDCYSVKPLDEAALREAARETGTIIVVEDHYPEGGMGEAVAGLLRGESVSLKLLAVGKKPRSGTTDELLDYEGVSAGRIAQTVLSLAS